MPLISFRIAPALVAVLLVGLVSTARADFIAVAYLSGMNERPTPNASTATGVATITFEAANNDFLYSVTFAGLQAPATIAHIHFGGPNDPGPVILPFTNAGPPNAAAGTFSGALTNADIINSATTRLTDISQIAAQIQAGNAYVNVHDAKFTGGEIRGQLSLVPEPASMASMALGVALLGGYSWRSRRRD